MKNGNPSNRIERYFRNQVARDHHVKNAYLLVRSEMQGVDLNVAIGHSGDVPAHPAQPLYMASVGKLFTATIASLLYEQGKLDFKDPLAQYLDAELINGLHSYKGQNYSGSIQIRHLLNHTPGLQDHFWPLLDKLLENALFNITPREAIAWTKENTTPHAPPGKKFKYSDTNYHLLGLIIEKITGAPFHKILHQYIFEPLGMQHSWMLHYSKPAKQPAFPMADFYVKSPVKMNDISGYAKLDFAGGGVVAPMGELLKFMQALVGNNLIQEDTLALMKEDRANFGMGIKYGYGIWQFVPTFLIMPKKFSSWGVAGATGAFLFYHPGTKSYIIGNFNHSSYQSKGVRYMLSKIINPLAKSS
jgi:D-alanyl-D-alanine carboxypeptidase